MPGSSSPGPAVAMTERGSESVGVHATLPGSKPDGSGQGGVGAAMKFLGVGTTSSEDLSLMGFSSDSR